MLVYILNQRRNRVNATSVPGEDFCSLVREAGPTFSYGKERFPGMMHEEQAWLFQFLPSSVTL